MAPKKKRGTAPSASEAREETHTSPQDTSQEPGASHHANNTHLHEGGLDSKSHVNTGSGAKRPSSSRREGSDQGESTSALEDRAGTKAIKGIGKTEKADLIVEDDTVDATKMEPPPKAGIVEPAGGYHTNPSPENRHVRVYADGVFDLFHLGYVLDYVEP